MNRLPSVIGPAPSELPWDSLIHKLTLERNRVRIALASYIPKQAKKKASPESLRKRAMKKEIQEMLKLAGVSPQELAAAMKGD